MTEQKIQHFADSAFLKIANLVITGIFIPLMLWGVYSLMDRLVKIEEAINKTNTISATVELRLQSIERSTISHDVSLQRLNERTTDHSYRILRLEERQDSKQ